MTGTQLVKSNICLALLAAAPLLHAQTAAGRQPVPPPKPPDAKKSSTPLERPTFVLRVLAFFGVLDLSLAKPDQPSPCGDLHVIRRGNLSGVWATHGQCLTSPVFASGGNQLYVLREGTLCRIRTSGDPQNITAMAVTGIEKLVGLDADRPQNLLVLKRINGELVAFDLSMKNLEPDPIPRSADDTSKGMLAYLAGWTRDYGTLTLEPQRDSAGFWNIYEIDRYKLPQNSRELTRCVNSVCSQPSLSLERDLVAYIQSSSPAPKDLK